VAEIENPREGILSRRYFTMVVFPEPDGAENIKTFPCCISLNSLPDFHFYGINQVGRDGLFFDF